MLPRRWWWCRGGAQSLWDALARARADYAPRVLAEAEDAVFRWYLPVARSLATGPAVTAVDPVAVEQAAELGLAQAVLGWRGPDCEGFERFARGVIVERLQRFPAVRGTGRLTSVPPAVPPLLGRDDDVAPEGAPMTFVKQRCRVGVGLVVSEHGVEDVDAAPGR